MVTIVTTLMFTKSYYPTCHFFGSNTLINKHGWHYSEKFMHVSSATITGSVQEHFTFSRWTRNDDTLWVVQYFQGGIEATPQKISNCSGDSLFLTVWRDCLSSWVEAMNLPIAEARDKEFCWVKFLARRSLRWRVCRDVQYDIWCPLQTFNIWGPTAAIKSN